MRSLSFFILIVALAGCASAPTASEYLDNETAATITVAAQSWIFARERSDLAVHAQDYITITPVQVNRSGRRVIYLYCHLWSTIDRRREKNIVPANAELALIADDRRVLLPNSASDIHRLGFGHAPVPLPNKAAELRAATTDADFLRFIAQASEVRIAMNVDGVTEYFEQWRSGREGVADFVRRVDSLQR